MVADNESLSLLNIVCEAKPTVAVAAANKKSKKPKNKYEKRRARAKKAKAEKDGTIATHDDSAGDEPVTADEPQLQQQDTNNIINDADDDGAAVTAQQTLTSEPLNTDVTTDGTAINTADATAVNDDRPKSSLTVVEPTKSSSSVESSLIVAKSSRKKNHLSLEDEEERAKYMAEYHARPMEMDRRFGANAQNYESKDSNHLFSEDKEQPSSLSIHPHLWRCLQTKFEISQPTIIQTSVLKAYFSNPTSNLLIQSETGSGKTLAYLLPVLQVSLRIFETFFLPLHGVVSLTKH